MRIVKVRRVEDIAPIRMEPGDQLVVTHTTHVHLEDLGITKDVSTQVFCDTFDESLTISRIMSVNIYDDDEFVAVAVYLGGPKLTPEFMGLEWDPTPAKAKIHGVTVTGENLTKED